MGTLKLLAVAALSALALPASAEVQNQFLAQYGPDVRVAEVAVSVRPDVFGKHQDRAARSFLAKRATPEQRAAVVQQGEPEATAMGETFAAWLGETLIRRRLNVADAPRTVRVAVEVTRFDMRSSPALPGSEALPIGDAKISFSIVILDSADGRELARAVVDDCIVATSDMEQARLTAGLKYAAMGSDIQFRMVAASMNAVSRYADAVLESPQLPTGSKTENWVALANGALVKDVLRHPEIKLTVSPPSPSA